MVRIVILDWDFHHGNVKMFLLSSYLILFSYNIQGNGSQDIWYKDERVLYISMHRWTLLFSYLYLFRWLSCIFAGLESIRERKYTQGATLERVTRLERNQQWGTTSTLVRSLYCSAQMLTFPIYKRLNHIIRKMHCIGQDSMRMENTLGNGTKVVLD